MRLHRKLYADRFARPLILQRVSAPNRSVGSKLLQIATPVASAIAAITSAVVAIRAFSVSSQQADTARQALLASTRAWLTVGVSLSSGIEKSSDGTLRLTLKSESSNTGRSPALFVRSEVIYDLLSWNAYEALKKWCHLEPMMRQHIFSELAFHQQVAWPGKELALLQTQFAFKPDELSKIDSGPNPQLLHIVQCVEYTISGDDRIHVSAGAWRLIKKRRDGPGNEGFPTDRSTPRDEPFLEKGWAGEAAYAD